MDKASPPDAPDPGSSGRPGTMHWSAIYADPSFQALLKKKATFIVPAVVFFVAYYFALPVLVGYAPALMEQKVVGNINLAYLFALSEFVVGWLLMALYLRRAQDFDRERDAVISAAERRAGGAS